MGAAISDVGADGATLLLLAFAPGHRIGLPRGADRSDLAEAFPRWVVTDEEPASTDGMPGPLKRTAPRFYRLARA